MDIKGPLPARIATSSCTNDQEASLESGEETACSGPRIAASSAGLQQMPTISMPNSKQAAEASTSQNSSAEGVQPGGYSTDDQQRCSAESPTIQQEDRLPEKPPDPSGSSSKASNSRELVLLSLEEAFFLGHELKALTVHASGPASAALTCEVLLLTK